MVRPSIYTQEEMDQFIAHGYRDRTNSLDICERFAIKVNLVGGETTIGPNCYFLELDIQEDQILFG